MKRSMDLRALLKRTKLKQEQSVNGLYTVKPAVTFTAGLVFFAAAAAGAYILSNNVAVSAVIALITVPFFARRFLRSQREKKKKKIEGQFLEAMELVLAAVNAGNSVEQAFQSVCDSYRNGGSVKIGDIVGELEAVCGKTGMLYFFYDELMLFAMKTKSEDVISCVKAMSIVGVRGGDMTYVIRNALANLRIRNETDAEIASALALPKYNLRIITVMPFALVLLVKSMSAGYMNPLYESRLGLVISLGAMAVIAAAWILGSRLCDIKL